MLLLFRSFEYIIHTFIKAISVNIPKNDFYYPINEQLSMMKYKILEINL